MESLTDQNSQNIDNKEEEDISHAADPFAFTPPPLDPFADTPQPHDLNLSDFEPWSSSDDDEYDDMSNYRTDFPIRLRCHKKNGHRIVTSVDGITDSRLRSKFKAIAKDLKKHLNCSTAMYINKMFRNFRIIVASGDQRKLIKDYFVSKYNLNDKYIIIMS